MNAHNVSEVAQALPRGDCLADAHAAARAGALCGIGAALVFSARPMFAMSFAAAGSLIAAVIAFFRPRPIDCSLCDTTLAVAAGRCPGCAAAIEGRR